MPDSAPKRLYTISSFGEAWAAGNAADGRQLLAAPVGSRSVGLAFFDQDGVILNLEEVRVGLSDPPQSPSSTEGCQIAEWVREISSRFGLRQTPIHVRKFEAPALGISIVDRPAIFEEFLADPERMEPDPEFRVLFATKIAEWDKRGNFVLNTPGNDYWMEPDGSVHST